MSEGFELLVDRRALCGEGPLWMSALNCLYWVDFFRREWHTYHRDSGVDEVSVLPNAVTALAATRSGQLVAATESGFERLFPGRAALETVTSVTGGDRMSGGACDPAGRFVAGSSTRESVPEGSAAYVLDGQRARLLVNRLTTPAGLGWSPDGATMYLVDSLPRTVWAYDYDTEHSRAYAPRRWVVCPEFEGRPEGMAVDTDGCVWVAMHGTGRIHRYAPNGDLETVLWAPTTRVTNLAFGGRRFDEMYVTSACFGYDERAFAADPHAGALFRFSPGAIGLAPTPWNGM